MSSFAHFPRVQWQRNAPPGVHRRCLRAFLWPPKTLFSVRTFAAVCARAWDDLPAMSRHTMSKAPREKPAFFLTGGQSFFMVSVSQRKLFFLCPVLCGCVGVEGAFPLWWCSILAQGGKAASPASASPWRTPANRSRTRLFSAPNSPAFRGSQQPLMAFPLEEPTRNFPPVCMN